uniref:Uncharacterized protein n=1 Tax=Eutreptiella gymnastica TaxID=73025 RepID=A0A7S4GB97_9EUGL
MRFLCHQEPHVFLPPAVKLSNLMHHQPPHVFLPGTDAKHGPHPKAHFTILIGSLMSPSTIFSIHVIRQTQGQHSPMSAKGSQMMNPTKEIISSRGVVIRNTRPLQSFPKQPMTVRSAAAVLGCDLQSPGMQALYGS